MHILDKCISFLKMANLKSDLQKLDHMETFKERIEFCNSNFKRLSSGSSRIVFKIDDEFVLKLAKNEKGIAQNKAEANPKMKSKYLNKIEDSSKKSFWIKTFYLEKINKKEFEELAKLSFDEFEKELRKSLDKKNYKSEFDIVNQMKIICNKFHLLIGDIVRPSSWGKKNNIPILIDAGLTEKIYKDYYKS